MERGLPGPAFTRKPGTTHRQMSKAGTDYKDSTGLDLSKVGSQAVCIKEGDFNETADLSLGHDPPNLASLQDGSLPAKEGESVVLTCPNCYRTFTTRGSLGRHMRSRCRSAASKVA